MTDVIVLCLSGTALKWVDVCLMLSVGIIMLIGFTRQGLFIIYSYMLAMNIRAMWIHVCTPTEHLVYMYIVHATNLDGIYMLVP